MLREGDSSPKAWDGEGLHGAHSHESKNNIAIKEDAIDVFSLIWKTNLFGDKTSSFLERSGEGKGGGTKSLKEGVGCLL